MSLQMIVALVGDPQRSNELDFGAGAHRPYRQFPTISLSVELNDTLSSALKRAASLFNIQTTGDTPFSPTWISFYTPSHDNGYTAKDESSVVVLVDDRGRALWNVPFYDKTVTVRALLAARDARALRGDPLRPYLVLRPGIGNGVVPNWEEWIVAFVAIRETLSIISDGTDEVAVAQWIRARARQILDRLQRVPEIAEEHRSDWERRKGWPHDVEGLIDRGPWHSQDLASLLRVTVEEAETLLRARGFTKEPSGIWTAGTDEESAATRMIYSSALSIEWSLREGEKIETFKAEMRRLIVEQQEPHGDDDIGS